MEKDNAKYEEHVQNLKNQQETLRERIKRITSGEHMKAWKEFQKKYGEGTAADLDYGKLAILVLVIYIAIQVT